MTVWMGRRRFLAMSAWAAAGAAFGGGCAASEQPRDGLLTARPRPGRTAGQRGTPGRLGLDRGRDAILQLPAQPSDAPPPLLVLLHGAGGSGAGILRRLGTAAADAGLVVLAPDSRGGTWDAVGGDFGPDVLVLNRALERVFESTAIDPARISIGGFSDGASYAISLGLRNGDLFRGIVAFSPGFFTPGRPQGRPRVFVSHGTADDVLPIDRCSRRIVPVLKTQGYDVTYREFAGGHDVPAAVAREGMRWAAAV